MRLSLEAVRSRRPFFSRCEASLPAYRTHAGIGRSPEDSYRGVSGTTLPKRRSRRPNTASASSTSCSPKSGHSTEVA